MCIDVSEEDSTLAVGLAIQALGMVKLVQVSNVQVLHIVVLRQWQAITFVLLQRVV